MKTMSVKVFEYAEYNVDIINNTEEGTVDFWLYERRNGYKSFMFGLMNKDIDYNNDGELINTIQNNIDDYIDSYEEDIELLEENS